MEGIVSLGSMKDIDIEALAAMEPDVIFSSDRTASSYDIFPSNPKHGQHSKKGG